MKVEFHGGRDIERALMELPRATAKAAARRIMRRALALFAAAANARAPRGEGVLSGSYGVGGRLTRRQAARARREGRDDVFMYAGTSDPAGQQQEFGNVNHPAQPHARPAWEDTQQEVFDVLQNGFAEEVRKTVERFARRAARSR